MILNDEQLTNLSVAMPTNPTYERKHIANLLDTIADLKKQVAKAVKAGAVVEMDREGGAYWTKAALDAYVQEKVDTALAQVTVGHGAPPAASPPLVERATVPRVHHYGKARSARSNNGKWHGDDG